MLFRSIQGRRAIVCAASKGLGRACAFSLAQNGVELVINARSAGPLEATAAEIRAATGVRVTAVAADITTPEGRAQVLGGGDRQDQVAVGQVRQVGDRPDAGLQRDAWQDAADQRLPCHVRSSRAVRLRRPPGVWLCAGGL